MVFTAHQSSYNVEETNVYKLGNKKIFNNLSGKSLR